MGIAKLTLEKHIQEVIGQFLKLTRVMFEIFTITSVF